MDTIFGMALLFAGAVCGGTFGLPSKFAGKDTPWEALWGAFFLFVTVLIPALVFPLVASGLYATCATAGLQALVLPVAFGFLWGLGSMALGMSFAFIGLSLAYAINYGAQLAVGGLGPMLIHQPDRLATTAGLVVCAGVAVCILGVVACGRAALLREASQPRPAGSGPAGGGMLKGLLIAAVSGVLCACYAIAFGFGGGVMTVAAGQGMPSWQAAFVVSALILWGGALSACGACVLKLTRNRTWGAFRRPGVARVLMVALVMAVLHDGAILLFGIGAARLGPLGVAVGYAMFMSFAILIGNLTGWLTGEWAGASRASIRWQVIGLAVLVAGVCLLATSSWLQSAAG